MTDKNGRYRRVLRPTDEHKPYVDPHLVWAMATLTYELGMPDIDADKVIKAGHEVRRLVTKGIERAEAYKLEEQAAMSAAHGDEPPGLPGWLS